MLCKEAGTLDCKVGLVQLTALPVGPVIVHDIEPAGVNPAVPVTTTLTVVVPPRVVEV